MPEKRTLETMTDTLRSRTAPAHLATLPPRSTPVWPRLARPAVVIGGIAALAIAFGPRPAVARGWASVQEATRRAENVHLRTYEGDELKMERWSSPGRSASILIASNGKIIGETRADAKRYYNFFDFIELRGSVHVAPNGRAFGTVQNRIDSAPRRNVASIEMDAETLIREGRSKKMDSPPSPGDWYEVAVPLGTGPRARIYRYTVRVDERQRIAEMRTSEGQVRTVYDYPETLARSLFEPRPQSRPVPVIDVDATRVEMTRRMKTGLGERRGVNLRLALLDREGKLFLFWTGPAIGEGTHGDVRVPGVRADRPAGLGNDFWQYGRPVRRGNAPSLGRPLPGRGIMLRQKIGDRITVAIPGRGGDAVFQNVPVLRIYDLRSERDPLGYGMNPTRR